MLNEDFVGLASGHGPDTEPLRRELVGYFESVNANVKCLHSSSDALYMAHEILATASRPGICAEFGCAAGGMAAKLSHVAARIGKQYFVFDTFEGLPYSADYEAYHPNVAKASLFREGMFRHGLDEVSENIDKHGRLDCCVFVKGRVEDTLRFLSQPVAFGFIDLDLAPSAREVIRAVWGRLTGNGIFTHEACVETYMEQIMDGAWWIESLGRQPPNLMHQVQARPYGLNHSPCLDFLYKDYA